MFKVELQGLKEVEKLLDPKLYRSAATSTINKLMAKSKTEAVDKAVSVWNIKKSDLSTTGTGKARLKVTRATWSDMTASFEVTGRPLSLALFGAKQIMGGSYRTKDNGGVRNLKLSSRMKKAGPMPQGVMVQLQKGRMTYLRQAFLGQVRAGKSGASHVGVFYRQGAKRLPILERRLITIPSMFKQQNVMQTIQNVITRDAQTIFNHELKFYMGRAK